MTLIYIVRPIAILAVFMLASSCQGPGKKQQGMKTTTTAGIYTNPLLESGAEPWAVYIDGTYYYTQGSDDRIIIWRTKDLTQLKHAEKKEVWLPKDRLNAFHLWGPVIYRVRGNWYIYYAADDGNTDNHHIYVIENTSPDPFEGHFELKGRIRTDENDNWAIHASILERGAELYMLWSGWQTRRVESETQCIYIAKMKDPWTLSSDRVLLSKPEFEWERQWINPDGTKTAYPIVVNEAPRPFYSPKRDKLFIAYSASGSWTPYYSVGMLWANATANLLDPASWRKSKVPVFRQSVANRVFSVGHVALVPSPDLTETYFLYHARSVPNDPFGAISTRSPRLQKLTWTYNGFPVFGIPQPVDVRLKRPSGTL